MGIGDAGETVGQMRERMVTEVYEAAKRCDIMVGSVASMWPICAMSAFLDACGRLQEWQQNCTGRHGSQMQCFDTSKVHHD
jgi:hypothetical protein